MCEGKRLAINAGTTVSTDENIRDDVDLLVEDQYTKETTKTSL